MSEKKKIKILLVDDQPSGLAALAAVLADLDEVLVSAACAEQALHALQGRDVALVLLRGAGLAELVCRQARTQAVPVIVLADGADDEARIEHVYALGAADYLADTVNPVILRARVGVMAALHRKCAALAGNAQASHLAALRTRDERMRLILDNTRDYAFIGTDPAGIVTEWEGGAENITGWWAASACGQPSAIIFTPADRAAGRPEEEMAQARSTGRAEDKRWHVRRDGTRFFADGVMVPLRDDQERLRGYAKIFRDATAERLAAEQLELSTVQLGESRLRSRMAEEGLRRLAAVAEQSSDFIGIADPDATATYLNPAGRRMAGLQPGAAIGNYALIDFFAPDSRATVHAQVLPALAGEQGQWEGELQLRRFDSGAAVPVYYKGFAVRDGDGRIIAMATITRDITQQKLAEDALRGVARDLAEADRRKSEFLATLAHELRNPLAPLRTGLDLLRLAGGDAAVSGSVVAMMDRQLGHLVHLVNDLLDVARITRGKIELKTASTDLATLVSMAVETSAALIQARGHALDVQVPAEALRLEVDVTRIVQVLSNLLNNAAKYTPAGGRITLSAWRDGAHAVLSVADTGVGIPAAAMPTLFDMFTQVGASLDQAQGGLGIGLSLVQRLVTLHGGSVGASSGGAGQGSTFVVRLPLAVAQAAPDEARAGLPPACGPLRILVVDDNADAGDSLAALLGVLGHTTRVAQDGEQGYAMAREFAPQLAFLDIGMPGMDGYQLARLIRNTPAMRGLLLVALTGWGTREDEAAAREAGFDCHLTKPVDLDALEAVFGALP
ncbi:MAG: response regulator [Pseudomonadota bacterium]